MKSTNQVNESIEFIGIALRTHYERVIKAVRAEMIEQFESIMDEKLIPFAELDEFRWEDLKREIKLELQKMKQEKEDV